jgi:hypothetical protein
MRRAGARPLGVRLTANTWAIFVDGMGAGERGLGRPWKPWPSQVMGEVLDEPRKMQVNGRSVRAVYGQMAKLNKRCLMMQVF